MKYSQSLKWLVLCAIAVSGFAVATDKTLSISAFAKSELQGWKEKSFSGFTEYEFARDDDIGHTVLTASASASASGLGKKITVNLKQTPFINWSWKIDNRLSGLEEATKAGDDYVARLYVVKSGGALLWKTRALNYVWSSSQHKDVMWPNAFRPKNAIMMSVRGKEDATGQWFTEKRNVYEDFKKAFGKNIDTIDAVAIMTDTDNSKQQAGAAYGEIYFTAN